MTEKEITNELDRLDLDFGFVDVEIEDKKLNEITIEFLGYLQSREQEEEEEYLEEVYKTMHNILKHIKDFDDLMQFLKEYISEFDERISDNSDTVAIIDINDCVVDNLFSDKYDNFFDDNLEDFLDFLGGNDRSFNDFLENTIFYNNENSVYSFKNLGLSGSYIKVTKSDIEAYKEEEEIKQDYHDAYHKDIEISVNFLDEELNFKIEGDHHRSFDLIDILSEAEEKGLINTEEELKLRDILGDYCDYECISEYQNLRIKDHSFASGAGSLYGYSAPDMEEVIKEETEDAVNDALKSLEYRLESLVEHVTYFLVKKLKEIRSKN